MTTTTALPTTETTLYLKRTFNASREQVFNAWTKPDILKQWFAAGDDFAGSVAETDLRVGGKFRMGMKHLASCKEHVGTGIYKEIKFRERLVFTWSWEGEPENGESQVTIELRDLKGQTEMQLKHEFFPTKKHRDDHEAGWNACFQKLAKVLQS